MAFARLVGESDALSGKEQTGRYIDVQMKQAGGPEDVFDHSVKEFIHDFTGGLPRAINNLATACLLLYALGRLSRSEPNSIPFHDVAPKLTGLLKEFGPSRKSYHPAYPFWRLQNDGVWIVNDANQLQRRTGQTHIPKKELLDNDVHAHFVDEIASSLQRDSSLVADVAVRLLDGHFPVSLHQDNSS